MIRTIGVVHRQKQEVGCIVAIPIDQALVSASRVAIAGGQAQMIMGYKRVHELHPGGEIGMIVVQPPLEQLVIPLDVLVPEPLHVLEHEPGASRRDCRVQTSDLSTGDGGRKCPRRINLVVPFGRHRRIQINNWLKTSVGV